MSRGYRERDRNDDRYDREGRDGRDGRDGREDRGGGDRGGGFRGRSYEDDDDGGRVSLLVRNLPMDAGADDVRAKFERYGDIRDVYLPKDFYTRRPRGFGFIEFRDARDAETALRKLDGTTMGGREISVVMSKEARKTPREMLHRDPVRTRGPSRRDDRHDRRSRSRSRGKKRSASRSRSPRRRSYTPRRSPSKSRSRSRSPRRERSASPVKRGSRSRSRSPRDEPAQYIDEPRNASPIAGDDNGNDADRSPADHSP